MCLAKRRAQMRWNSFVASPGSRLEGLMLGRLGPALWGDFVRHASLYREAYIASFLRPVLSCEGSDDGKPCPHNFRVDMDSPDAGSMLESLHLDHEVKVSETCNMRHPQLPASLSPGTTG